jgi:hypothetical protein
MLNFIGNFIGKIIKKDINIIENYSAFLICTSSISCLLLNYKIFEFSQYLIYYFIFDTIFFKKKIDIIIHHILVILMYSNYYIYNVPLEEFIKLFKIILLVEVSNIFLMLKIIFYLPNNIKIINNILFIISFIYFRIYYYYYYAVRQNQQIDIIVNNYLIYDNDKYFFYSSFYGFYLLNIYWTVLIFNKLYNLIINYLNILLDNNKELEYILKFNGY